MTKAELEEALKAEKAKVAELQGKIDTLTAENVEQAVIDENTELKGLLEEALNRVSDAEATAKQSPAATVIKLKGGNVTYEGNGFKHKGELYNGAKLAANPEVVQELIDNGSELFKTA